MAHIETEANKKYSDIIFYYNKDDTMLTFDFQQFYNSEDIPTIGIPSDTHNITEKEINGQTMYILEEENQFTATFLRNNMIYVIFSDGLDYEECDKIVNSIK